MSNPSLSNERADDKPGAYAFDADIRRVPFPVDWPGAVNREHVKVFAEKTEFEPQQIIVTHAFKRETPEMIADYYAKTAIKARNEKGGAIEYLPTDGAADYWLWEQLALSVAGYPELNGEDRAVAALPKRPGTNETAIHNAHKARAIERLFRCEFRILDELCSFGMDGGTWAGELIVGSKDTKQWTIPMRFRQWESDVERRFHTNRSSIRSGGKANQTTTIIKPAAYADVFDNCVEAIENATVEGQSFAEHRNRPQFLKAISPIFKVTIVSALRERWDSADRD